MNPLNTMVIGGTSGIGWALALHYLQAGHRVAVCGRDPGKIDAEFIAETPMGRIGLPADVSATVAFLASDEASFISGAIIDVTGGQFMP